jgi:sporulation protein YlmC with PRC-barrel domain
MATLENLGSSHPQLIAASEVKGTNVYNPAGEKLGNIHDVMFDKTSGKAEYAILSFGGFLSIGEGYHPLPWNQLSYDHAVGGYVINLDSDRLGGAPVYQQGEVSMWDERRRSDIDSYYGSRLGDPLGSDIGLGGSALER